MAMGRCRSGEAKPQLWQGVVRALATYPAAAITTGDMAFVNGFADRVLNLPSRAFGSYGKEVWEACMVFLAAPQVSNKPVAGFRWQPGGARCPGRGMQGLGVAWWDLVEKLGDENAVDGFGDWDGGCQRCGAA